MLILHFIAEKKKSFRDTDSTNLYLRHEDYNYPQSVIHQINFFLSFYFFLFWPEADLLPHEGMKVRMEKFKIMKEMGFERQWPRFRGAPTHNCHLFLGVRRDWTCHEAPHRDDYRPLESYQFYPMHAWNWQLEN